MKAAAAAAIINFLWEGVAIGALAALGFSLSRSPRVRHLVGIVALAVMAAAPVATFSVAMRANAAEVHGPSSTVHSALLPQDPGADTAGIEPGRGTADRSAPWTVDLRLWTSAALERASVEIHQNATLVLVIWLCGVALLSMRLAWGWIGARRLTRRVTTAGASVIAIADRLAESLRVRARVRVVESALVKVPAVVGAFKPVVLLPAAAMTGLSMEQVEALLAHELAHVSRHDYLVNLLQSAVETLLFYHPAVWLVSRRVRQERELCCDDLALSVCGDRVAYASALADLESLRVTPSPALAATGGSLLARVRRILGHDEVSALAGRSQSVAGVAILASIILLAGGQIARARVMPAANQGFEILDADGPGGKRASDAPQIQGPVLGEQDGVPGGVPGGLPTGVRGGEAAGVVGGVQGGVAAPGQGIDRDPHLTIGINTGLASGVRGGLPVSEIGVVAPARNQDSSRALQPGDGIFVSVWSPVPQPEFSKQSYRLREDGTVVLPHLQRPVKLSGFTTAEAQEQIRLALIAAKQYASPTVEVTLTRVSDLAAQTALEHSVIGPFRAGDHIRIDLGVEADPNSIRLFTTVPPGGAIQTASFPMQTAALAAIDGIKIAGETSATIIPEIVRRLRSANLSFQTILVTFDDRHSDNASRLARREGVVPASSLVAEAPKSLSVTVQGAVRNPGNVVLRADRNTILDAVGAAGGTTAAAGSRIFVKRAGSEDLTYSRELLMKDQIFDKQVHDGDVIRVEVAPHFYVTGFVKNSQSDYNWEPGMTLRKAIALAGGPSQDGAINRVEIQRKDPKSGDFKPVKLDKDRMSTPIQADDVIKVPKKWM